ncbi:MAG TPA: xanthorhodopsin [Myxococcales bacterium]|nr:xanthorhodopsin [Myxococcales bacterium]HAN32040.1 xanthorhodopsin [Myxococcales bacterium]
MTTLPTLSYGEYQLVYNMLSFAIAAMVGSFAFFVLARSQVSARFRPALVMSSLVVGIAAYHYFRIFNSWEAAFVFKDGVYSPSGQPFNDAYRYVDWLLTVPLLCAELVSVLALTAAVRGPLMTRMVIASALMVALGYPGEIATDITTRAIWGAVSTVPFLYLMYALWIELSKAIPNQPPRVQTLFKNTRLLLFATWGFYPIAYLMPQLGIAGSTAEVSLQVGYSLADVAAKCGYGLMIYAIARAKMDAAGETAGELTEQPA